ncbi:MAG: lysophospholipid acyltransferase family protein [Burkholderiaceae bacterium]
MTPTVAVLRYIARSALLYALLLCLGGVSLAWNLLAVVLRPLLPAALGQALGRAVIARIYRVFWRVAQGVGMLRIDAQALDVLRHERGGLIVAANHPSMLDALLIVAWLPRGVCIMKAALRRNIFLGAGARLARYIHNDSAHSMIRDAVRSLRDGAHLIVFPEGTRTHHRPVNAFLPGVTLIAQRAQVSIQTVIIETDSPYLGKDWPIWRTPPAPVVFKLRLGERFAPQADHAALLRELEAYFVRELRA